LSTKVRRLAAWVVGVISLGVIVALIVTAVFDLQKGDSTASVTAGVVAVVGLAISAITLIMSRAPGGPPPARAQVRSKGRGAIAAGGNVSGNAIGKDAKVTGLSIGPATRSRGERSDVAAEGSGAISAGGDITDNAIGEGSER
jgi:hypothetical protein